MNNKIKILGMHCASCSSRVEKTVKDIPGLSDVNVNLATETLTFTSDENFDLSIVEKAVIGRRHPQPRQLCGGDHIHVPCPSSH